MKEHPDYAGVVWSCPEVKSEVLSLDSGLRVEVFVERVMKILEKWGYDSFDRECAFAAASHESGIDYGAYYDVWLAGAGVW